MVNKVKRYIQQKALLSVDSKIIVGLSGGADSVVLLHLLHQLGYSCIAAHCNFHLRGDESMRDEDFASSFSASLNIPFYKIDFETKQIASERKISIEMAARDLRYEWFEQLRKDCNADVIAVAHHQDDSVETMLLNLIRGTGIKGLTGINSKNGLIIRPLLCLQKKEILQYACEEELYYVADSSNLQDEFTRNKIRLQVLPLLRRINPSVSEALAQTMENLKEAAEIYDAGIIDARLNVFDQENGIIHIAHLQRYPSPESILHEILKDYGFGREVVKDALEAMNSQPGKVFYSPIYCLVKDRDAYILTPRKENQEAIEYKINFNSTGIEEPLLLSITYQEQTAEFKIIKDKHIGYFDVDKLQFPLVLRKWRNGDRFIPFGMQGFQKLSDYFSDHKFSKPEKEKAWILCSGEDIVWIVGERTDNRFRVDEETKIVSVFKFF